MSEVKAEFHVYDANDQYLGILANDIGSVYNKSFLPVFVPSLNRVSYIEKDGKVNDYLTITSLSDYDRIFYFETTDCSGTAYVYDSSLPIRAFNLPDIYIISYSTNIEEYYKVDFSAAPKTFVPKSKTTDFGCQPIENQPSNTFYPCVKVDALPASVNLFPAPVVFPLKFRLSTFDVNCDGVRGLAESVFILQEVAGAGSK